MPPADPLPIRLQRRARTAGSTELETLLTEATLAALERDWCWSELTRVCEKLDQLRADLAAATSERDEAREQVERLNPTCTLTACESCGRGVRPRDAEGGVCLRCVATRLKAQRDAAAAVAIGMDNARGKGTRRQIAARVRDAIGRSREMLSPAEAARLGSLVFGDTKESSNG